MATERAALEDVGWVRLSGCPCRTGVHAAFTRVGLAFSGGRGGSPFRPREQALPSYMPIPGLGNPYLVGTPVVGSCIVKMGLLSASGSSGGCRGCGDESTTDTALQELPA